MLNKIKFIVVFISFLVGCKSKKEFIESAKKDQMKSAAPVAIKDTTFLKLLNESDFVFNEISINGKLAISFENDEQKSNITFRIKKDSVIWLSIRAIAGIEIIRASITQDSIYFINRLEKEYSIKPFSFIYSITGVHLQFSQLQALLLGNSNSWLNSSNITNDSIGGYKMSLSENVCLNFKIDDKINKIDALKAVNLADSKMLELRYLKFQKLNSKYLPTEIICTAITNKQLKFELGYDKFTFDENMNYPFTIPAKYKHVE